MSAQRRTGLEVDEELAVALRPLDRRRDDARACPSPAAAARATVSRSTRRWIAGSRTTPPFASALPASNCGFTRATIGPAPSRSTARIGASTSPSEMNETSTTARSTGSGSVDGVERPGVDALHRHDARVAPEPLGELPVARRRPRRPGVAPRCSRTSVKPPVEAPTSSATRPAGIHAERVERREQLVRAAADPRRPPATSIGTSIATRSPLLRSRRAPSPSPTRTWPASSSAWARARVSASPRSTRSWSRRIRRAVVVGMRLSWHRRLTADVRRNRPGSPRFSSGRRRPP